MKIIDKFPSRTKVVFKDGKVVEHNTMFQMTTSSENLDIYINGKKVEATLGDVEVNASKYIPDDTAYLYKGFRASENMTLNVSKQAMKYLSALI